MIKTRPTKGDPSDRAIQGIDEKEFDGIQHLEGMYPEFVGQQTRIGGKTLHEVKPYPIHGIYIFYNYYGRRIFIYEFRGGFDIVIPDPPIPPVGGTVWHDDFESYALDYTTPLYPGGVWGEDPGIVSTYDYFISDMFSTYGVGEIEAEDMEFMNSGIFMIWDGPWIETIYP